MTNLKNVAGRKRAMQPLKLTTFYATIMLYVNITIFSIIWLSFHNNMLVCKAWSGVLTCHDIKPICNDNVKFHLTGSTWLHRVCGSTEWQQPNISHFFKTLWFCSCLSKFDVYNLPSWPFLAFWMLSNPMHWLKCVLKSGIREQANGTEGAAGERNPPPDCVRSSSPP